MRADSGQLSASIHPQSPSTAPRRILMTTDAVGGVWQYTVDLAEALASRGIELCIACLGPAPSERQRQQLTRLPPVSLFERSCALEWMPGAGADVKASGEWLLQLADRFRPDLVHLNGYAHGALPFSVPVLIAAHSCTATWWRAVYGCAAGPEWNEYRSWVAAGLAGASIIVAQTAALASALAHEHPADSAKMRVIYNFTSVPVADSLVKRPICLAAGRIWDTAKNIRLLEHVAPRTAWPIEVAGNERSPEDEDEVRFAQGLNLLGELPHEQLIERMRSASLFLHPALYEPFGLAVLEAARSRCCLVLAAIPSLQELWSGCAQFADPRDPQQWIFEVQRLIANARERENLALRAQARSLRFTADAAVQAYLDCYRDILCDRKPPLAKETAA